MKYVIGIDIGGTNTDAVLIDQQERIVSFAKVSTTEDVAIGVEKALDGLLLQEGKIVSIVVGTTQATNAILQRRELYKVGIIRVAGQYPDSPPPCFGWPKELSDTILSGYATVAGGFECHGAPIRNVNEEELRKKIALLLKQGAESIAVVGVFSPMNGAQELRVAALIREMAGMDFPITLSHKISGVGFLERENSSILNAALKKVMKKGFEKLQKICTEKGFDCPLSVTQNNGSRIDLQEAIEHPILTLSAGPTNSFVGGSRLCDLHDGIIVDIGGTSTDIGLIKNGVFRRSLNISNIGGVKLNFPMPDVVSLAIGGGSYVELCPIRVGPRSVGREILSRARSFGGSQLTLTDAALSIGQMEIQGHESVLMPEEAIRVLGHVVEEIESHIALMTPDTELPIILVGGGSALLPKFLLNRRYYIPKHAFVANAYGAALAGISGEVDLVVSLTDQEETMRSLKAKALDAARQRGAYEAEITDIQIIPYHYTPNNMARVIVTAFGKGAPIS